LDDAPYGGNVFIADTSAWARAHRDEIQRDWQQALHNRQIATCPIVKLEFLRSARTGAEFDEWAADLAELHNVPVTRSVTNAAESAFRRLAHASPGPQRAVPLPDLVIAACAQDAAVGVLHYDEHFDRLAEVLSFESRWIAPRGAL
jgi:predicted nucleic acid-binding protein